MKWSNLKINKCPQCDKPFDAMSFSSTGRISCFNCHYIISQKRFSEIVNSQIMANLERKWDEEQEEIKP